jgi:hypothetical protein
VKEDFPIGILFLDSTQKINYGKLMLNLKAKGK